MFSFLVILSSLLLVYFTTQTDTKGRLETEADNVEYLVQYTNIDNPNSTIAFSMFNILLFSSIAFVIFTCLHMYFDKYLTLKLQICLVSQNLAIMWFFASVIALLESRIFHTILGIFCTIFFCLSTLFFGFCYAYSGIKG